MSGPKAGEISYEIAALSNSFKKIVNNAASNSNIRDIRNKHHIALRAAKLKSQIKQGLLSLEKLNSNAKNLGDSTPYSEIVYVPGFSEMRTNEELEEGLGQLNNTVSEYRGYINDFYKNAIIEKKHGLQELLTTADQEGVKPLFTSTSIIPCIENEATMAANDLNQQLIQRYASKATDLLSNFEQHNPNVELPVSIIQLAQDIFTSKSQPQARSVLEKIDASLNSYQKDLEHEKQAKKHQQELNNKGHISMMVGSVITATFEEMGYEVSGIEETCFVKNGEIFAQHPTQPGFAVKFKLNKADNSTFTTEPVQITPKSAAPYQRVNTGHFFDSFWCNNEQMGTLINKLSEKKIYLPNKVKAITPAKEIHSNLPESIQNPKKYLEKLQNDLNELSQPREREI